MEKEEKKKKESEDETCDLFGICDDEKKEEE